MYTRALEQVGLNRHSMQGTGVLLLRGALLGSALYLALTEDPEINLRLNFIWYAVAVVWSYFDGVLRERSWGWALFEAVPVHLMGLQFGSLLVLIFSSPLQD